MSSLIDLVQRPYEMADATAIRALAVPPIIESKLTHLVDRAASARAAQAVLVAQLREARDEHRAVDARLHRQRGAAALRPKSQPLTAEDREAIVEGRMIERANGEDPAATIPALEARLTVATRAVDRLTPRVTEASESADAAGILAQHAAEWFRPRSTAELETATADARRVVAGLTIPNEPVRLTAELKKVRSELQSLEAERATIAATAVTTDEARARVLAVVENAKSEWSGFALERFFLSD